MTVGQKYSLISVVEKFIQTHGMHENESQDYYTYKLCSMKLEFSLASYAKKNCN